MSFLHWIKRQLHMDDPQQRKREFFWLLGQFKQQRKALILISILSLTGICMSLGGNLSSKYLIDSITGFQASGVVFWGCLFASLIVGSLILSSVSGHLTAKLRIRAINTLRKDIFSHILASRWESLEPYRSGELLNLLNSDVGTVADASASFLPGFLGTLVRFAGTFAIMLYFEPVMALIALFAIPILVLLSGNLTRKMRRYDLTMKEMNGNVMSFQSESFRNLTSIKAFALTDLFTGELDKLQHSYEQTYLDATGFHLGMNFLLSLGGMTVTALGMCYGVYQLWQGNISYGSVTMLLSLAGTLRSSFSAMFSQVKHAISITNSAGRLMALEALPTEDTQIPENLSEEDIFLVLEQVSFSYQNGNALLYPFDFHAAPGDVIAITGPSGEGKTTLLRLLLGLVAPQSGKASILDAHNRSYPLNAGTRYLFSYVPQGNSIFTGTVAQNLRFLCPDATDAQLWAALDAVCAGNFVRELPLQLDQLIGPGGQGLSEGQAQRLAIARALLRKAPILLLDEATSALDSQTEQKLLENLRTGNWVRTCILVTHRSASAAFCSRSYDILQGRVTEVDHGA